MDENKRRRRAGLVSLLGLILLLVAVADIIWRFLPGASVWAHVIWMVCIFLLGLIFLRRARKLREAAE